jgi:hypothetical protein
MRKENKKNEKENGPEQTVWSWITINKSDGWRYRPM